MPSNSLSSDEIRTPQETKILVCRLSQYLFTVFFFVLLTISLETAIKGLSINFLWALFLGPALGVITFFFPLHKYETALAEPINSSIFTNLFRRCTVDVTWRLISGVIIIGFGANYYLPDGLTFIGEGGHISEQPQLNREPISVLFFLLLLGALHSLFFQQYAAITANPSRCSRIARMLVGVLMSVWLACGLSFLLAAIAYPCFFLSYVTLVQRVNYVSRLGFELWLVYAMFHNGFLLSIYWMSIFFINHDIMYEPNITTEPEHQDVVPPVAPNPQRDEMNAILRNRNRFLIHRAQQNRLRANGPPRRRPTLTQSHINVALDRDPETRLIDISHVVSPGAQGQVLLQTNFYEPGWEHRVWAMSQN